LGLRLKIAILHYWFLLNGGGEQVIKSLLNIFPAADVFCLFAQKESIPPNLNLDKLHLSYLDKLPFSHSLNRVLFPLYPAAVGSFDFSSYDLILSSDSPPLKAIVPSINGIHISYTHTPGRFIWDLSGQFGSSLPSLLRPLFHTLASSARESDFIAAQRVDHFVANSCYVSKRITKYYRRTSTVIYPPVETESAYISESPQEYYLSVGRLTATKRVDLLISACNKIRRRLVVVGTGREEERLKAIAGPTIEFLGRIDNGKLTQLYAECRAFLFAADEDFGIVPVEAQAFGRPVIAYGHGGVLETVRASIEPHRTDTGVLFKDQSVESVVQSILVFEDRESEFDPLTIRAHALLFDKKIFETKMKLLIGELTAVGSSMWSGSETLNQVAVTQPAKEGNKLALSST
jgi:glycosyltransferase involved in cell wall biosynthesis